MKYMKWLLGGWLLLLCSLQGKGQSVDNLDKAIELLNKVNKNYDTCPISFDIRYTYAGEQQPDAILDSLNGHIILSGSNCFAQLGNTIFLTNQKYSIAVFTEEKLIHVSRAANKDSLHIMPMEIMAAAIRQAGIKSCLITSGKEDTKIRCTFTLSSAYKYLEIAIDTKNWRILRMQYVVKNDMITGTAGLAGTLQAPYALVNASFTHYDPGTVSGAVFDDRQFFTRTATALVPTRAYEDYEVFIGSPNL